jgi:hypothetical protein
MKKISLTIATIFLLSSATANAQDHSTHKEEMENVAHSNAAHKEEMKAVDHEKAAHKSHMKSVDHADKTHKAKMKAVDRANEKHDAEMKNDSEKASDEKAGNKEHDHNHKH